MMHLPAVFQYEESLLFFVRQDYVRRAFAGRYWDCEGRKSLWTCRLSKCVVRIGYICSSQEKVLLFEDGRLLLPLLMLDGLKAIYELVVWYPIILRFRRCYRKLLHLVCEENI
jgi:hypothetical protein